MSTAAKGARLVPVSDTSGTAPTPRGKAIMDRLERLGIAADEMSESELKNVLNIDPATWKRMQAGLNVRPTSFTKAETALAAYVEEHGLQGEDAEAQGPAATAETIEYEIEGYRGVGFKTFRVKGPVADARQMEESVIRILTRLQRLEHEAEKPAAD